MKDPAVLFYTQDFLTGTLLMSDEQIGKYIKLLCLQHQNGGLTEKEMLKICGEFDEDIFKKFEIIEGKYCNKRMLLESDKRHKFTESRRANAKHMDKHMENENENEDVIEDEDEKKKEKNKTEFIVFWNLYDKKEDREKCERKWNVMKELDRQKCIRNLPAYIASTPDKNFRRHPATYLNNKSWENEIVNPMIKVELPKTYEEMLKMAETNPDIFKSYKAVRKDGERKAVFYKI